MEKNSQFQESGMTRDQLIAALSESTKEIDPPSAANIIMSIRTHQNGKKL